MLRLPRSIPSWTKLSFARRNTLFRSLGLELPFLLSYGHGAPEQPKVVVRKSRRLAFARCGVHIIPISISMVLICFNLFHSYLGRTLPGAIIDPTVSLALLQIAAKIHELAIVASLATIVIHAVRQELVHGEGVPLGILVGSFMFSGLNYFWSPELIGSLKAKCKLSSRIRLVVIIVLAGLVAALSGPASAVLLIPKEQPWGAGGSTYYLPTSSETLWPENLNGTGAQAEAPCPEHLLEHGLCLAGGYISFRNGKDLVDIFKRPAYVTDSGNNLTTNMILGPRGVDITNNFEMTRSLRYSGNFRGYACDTGVIGTRVVDAIYHKQLMQDWAREALSIGAGVGRNHPTLANYKYYRSLTATTSSRIPAVRVVCTPAQQIAPSSRKVEFPVLDPLGCSPSARKTELVEHDSIDDTESDSVRAFWNDRTINLGSVSTTFMIKWPANGSDGATTVIGCSIDARWADGTTLTSDLRSYATSSNLNLNFDAPISLGPIFRGPSTGLGQSYYSEFRPVLQNPTSTRIVLGRNWLYDQILSSNSSGTERGGWTAENFRAFLVNSSIFEDIPTSSKASADTWNAETPGLVNRTVALEWTLALIVADALSRTGSEHILDTAGPVSSWLIREYERVPSFQKELFRGGDALKKPSDGTPLTEGKVWITIGGYSYQASSVTDYLSIALLGLHILIALTHIFLLFYKGESSSSWDSLAELLVLAQNSRPAPTALRNTNAGIGKIETYSQVARVYAVSPWNNRGEDARSNVELIYDEKEKEYHADDHIQVMSSILHERNGNIVVLEKVQPDVKYGHLDDTLRRRLSSDRHTI